MFTSLLWESNQYRLARSVKPRPHPHPLRRRTDLVVQMDDHGWSGIELYDAQPPGQPLAEKKIIAVMQR